MTQEIEEGHMHHLSLASKPGRPQTNFETDGQRLLVTWKRFRTEGSVPYPLEQLLPDFSYQKTHLASPWPPFQLAIVCCLLVFVALVGNFSEIVTALFLVFPLIVGVIALLIGLVRLRVKGYTYIMTRDRQTAATLDDADYEPEEMKQFLSALGQQIRQSEVPA